MGGMEWVSDCGRARLFNADCRVAMAGLEAESIDSIVCDPPYGLSDKRRDSLSDVFISEFFDVFLPKFNYAISKSLGSNELIRPLDRVSFLDRVNRSFWVEPGVRVPESSVDFDCDLVDWNEEIKHAYKPSVAVPDRELSDILDAHRVKNGNSFFLKMRTCVNSALSDSAAVGIPESGFGRVRVFVVIPFNSCFAGFLRTITPSDAGGLADIVGLLNDPKAFAESPSTVMTSNGAELRAVLSFNLRSGTCEIKPTNGAIKADAIFELVCPESIGAITGTSSLSSMFKPYSVGLVDAITNGTFTVNFHAFTLSYINRESSGFMGKGWDHGVPGVEFWVEALRVAKPGSHLLAFGGTRTYHRLACAIEDAGWEIRDCVMWVYGSGFPKSHDVSKAIDKAAGAEREKVRHKPRPKTSGTMSGSSDSRPWIERSREVGYHEVDGQIPATDAARQWSGWGTALKPAWEPVIVARKPLDNCTVAENVLRHGTGGDQCGWVQGGDGAFSIHVPLGKRVKRAAVSARDTP